MSPSRALLLLAMVSATACDGDGCNGGPTGSATKFCQESFARIGDASAFDLPSACKSCCLQEVPYEGRVEDGRCVCRR